MRKIIRKTKSERNYFKIISELNIKCSELNTWLLKPLQDCPFNWYRNQLYFQLSNILFQFFNAAEVTPSLLRVRKKLKDEWWKWASLTKYFKFGGIYHHSIQCIPTSTSLNLYLKRKWWVRSGTSYFHNNHKFTQFILSGTNPINNLYLKGKRLISSPITPRVLCEGNMGFWYHQR